MWREPPHSFRASAMISWLSSASTRPLAVRRMSRISARILSFRSASSPPAIVTRRSAIRRSSPARIRSMVHVRSPSTSGSAARWSSESSRSSSVELDMARLTMTGMSHWCDAKVIRRASSARIAGRAGSPFTAPPSPSERRLLPPFSSTGTEVNLLAETSREIPAGPASTERLLEVNSLIDIALIQLALFSARCENIRIRGHQEGTILGAGKEHSVSFLSSGTGGWRQGRRTCARRQIR